MRDVIEPGMLLVDKPAGISSFAALSRLRPGFGRKLGHAGTLDPFATGLLVVLTGRATRLASLLVGADKAYDATIRFGFRSTTDDPEGALVATELTTGALEIQATLPSLTGAIQQVPPAASAIHIDGERAYRRFRRGEEVTVPARAVMVHSFILLRFDPTTQTAEVRISCGSGTYIRSLARDLGDLLGCGAYLTALRRTTVGRFSLQAAAPLQAIVDAPAGTVAWSSAATAVGHLPQRLLDPNECTIVGHGGRVAAAAEQQGPIVLVNAEGRLIAIGDADGTVVSPRIVLEAC